MGKMMKHVDYDALLMEHSNTICYICDVKTHETLHMTKAAMDLYGLKSPDEYAGKACHEILHGLKAPCPFCASSRLSYDKSCCLEYYNEKLGLWISASDKLIDIEGHPCRMGIAHDITAQKEQMNRLSEQLLVENALIDCIRVLAHERDMKDAINHFLETIGKFYCARRAYIFEFDSDSVFMDNTFEWCAEGVSREIERLQGLPTSCVAEWIRMFEEKGEFYITSIHHDLDPDSADYQILSAQGIESLLAAPLVKDGRITGFLGVDDPSRSSDNLTLLRAASDFILEELEKRRLISELEYASYTDILTGLKNRNQYIRALQEYTRRPPDTLGVIFVDINGMKKTNDTYGHNFGDYVIVRVATLMKEHLTGQLFRIGGDEFVALCPNMEQDVFYENAAALRRRFEDDEDCDVSLGCIWRSGELNIQNQILQADDLMYTEKQSYYRAVLRTGRLARTGMASEVLGELAAKRFVVFYQPQFNIKNQLIIGAEALVRKINDDGTLIPPDHFIPFYELEGVIRHVDLYVLETVCRHVQRWMEEGVSLNISVNFSRVTLMEPDIVATIQEICGRFHVPPAYLTVEITESISKMDHEQLKLLVESLTKAGFTISLDDFGSKYSNLSILSALDFDVIKFDKTLVDELEHNPKSQAVMQNSIHICQDLNNTHSIAEGIETRGQLDLLSDYSCDYGQGYYFSKPLSFDEFDALIKKQAEKL